MSKMCPQCRKQYPDSHRKCPEDGNFLVRIPATSPPAAASTNTSAASPLPTEPSKPKASALTPKPSPAPQASPVNPADCYPCSSPPDVRGKIKNLRKTEVKSPFVTKVLESLSSGMPLSKGDTVHTFQVFTQDQFGRDITCTNVVVKGDIYDGQLYEGNIVKVWGKAPKHGSLRAKMVYNESSGTILRINRGVSTGTLWVIVASILALLVLGIMNFQVVAAAAIQLIVILGIGIIGAKLFFNRLFRLNKEENTRKRSWWDF